MLLKQKIVSFFLFNFFISLVFAQTDKIFTFEDFIAIVKQHHPIAYVADLKTEEGLLYIQKAKGGFDPKLDGEVRQKYFDGKQYYSYLNSGLKVPTWFGITVQGGYDLNGGERLSREAYTAEQGLWNAGIGINLGKGLFIDERRAELKQAKIYNNSTQLERTLIINQLVLDASLSFFDWFKAYNKYKIYEAAVINSTELLNNIRESASQGDKAAVDTLKALIQLQDRSLKLEQARVELQNKKAFLEVYLWQDGFIPLEISDSLLPDLYTETEINPIVDSVQNWLELSNKHPEFLISQNKIAISKIDYRLKKESLKPTVELKYNALKNDLPFDNYTIENYNWGAKIAYPIFTRKERANVKLAELKINEQEASLENKNALLAYKIEAAYNYGKSTENQVTIYRKAVDNYRKLYQSELTLFNIGESSMFLVNTRDQQLLDAQTKLVEIITENKQSNVWYKYSVVGL